MCLAFLHFGSPINEMMNTATMGWNLEKGNFLPSFSSVFLRWIRKRKNLFISIYPHHMCFPFSQFIIHLGKLNSLVKGPYSFHQSLCLLLCLGGKGRMLRIYGYFETFK